MTMDKPTQNADGSTDLYLGPRAPEGKQGNWLATVPDKGVFRHPQPLTIYNLYADPREEKPTADTWVVGPVLRIVGAFEQSVKQ